MRAHLQAGLNAVAEQHLFWDYAGTVAPAAGFDSTTHWLEGSVKPGLSWTRGLDSAAVHGKVRGPDHGRAGPDHRRDPQGSRG